MTRSSGEGVSVRVIAEADPRRAMRTLIAWRRYWTSLLCAMLTVVFMSWEWHSYYNFERFIAANPTEAVTNLGIHGAWVATQRESASFIAMPSPPSAPAQLIAVFPYRDEFLRLRHIYLVRR